MDVVVLIIAVSFMGIGFLVKRYPNSISGYGNLSAEKKKKIDIKGLSTHYCNGMVILGALTILLYYIIKLAGFQHLAELSFMPVILVGMMIVIAGGFKYDHNPKKTAQKAALWIMGVVVVCVCSMLVNSYNPHKVIIENDSLTITGSYGVTVHKGDIQSAELRESLPPIGIRTNGSAIGGVLKGQFRVGGDLGKARIFIHPRYEGPYLIIRTGGGVIIVETPDNIHARDYLLLLTGGGESGINQQD